MIFTFCRLAINRVVYPNDCVVCRYLETEIGLMQLNQPEHDETHQKHIENGNGDEKKAECLGTAICERNCPYDENVVDRIATC